MRTLKMALGAGVASIAALGFGGLALAQGPQVHTMTLTLPGGGVEQIQYSGRVAPDVTVSDAPAPVFAAMPEFFGSASPFADMERISAAMDRQANRMFQEAGALDSGLTQPDLAALSAMPAGAHEYSFVSTMSGDNVCSRSMVITSAGNGAAPHVVTHVSGNCPAVGVPGYRMPTQLPTAPQPGHGPRAVMTKTAPAHPSTAPRTVMAEAVRAHPYQGLVHEASLN